MTRRQVQSRTDDSARPRRGRGDDGAALLEFALVGGLLMTLLFGIITFGLILSFKQDVTRAAAEGARGGAVAIPLTTGQSFSTAAQTAATNAVNDAVKSMGGSFSSSGCSRTGMTCTASVAPCTSQASYNCVTVTVSFDYQHNNLYGNIPLISAFFPKTVSATSVARINS
jgi:Flp pilus assembly protein TadG